MCEKKNAGAKNKTSRTINIVFQPNDCNLNGQHVAWLILMLEMPGTLRTNISLMMIYHQTP